ncbi:MAG TPA: ECF-type sigma factor, partial [Gemmataceae bacterium]|nr:ECF-type sigma factor [Gemmataceae bacterium]
MSDVTKILKPIEEGRTDAAQELLPLVYDALRRLARERIAQEKPGQTLQATALVHEAYVRLVDQEQVQRWESRGHFYAAASEAMRRILVERAPRGPLRPWHRLLTRQGLAAIAAAASTAAAAATPRVPRAAAPLTRVSCRPTSWSGWWNRATSRARSF